MLILGPTQSPGETLRVVTETETHMVSKRAVCILLECFLILIKNVKSKRTCVPKSVKVQQLGVSPQVLTYNRIGNVPPREGFDLNRWDTM